LGPNLQSRLEALEAAMGVRLNLAKAQGRHSLSNSKLRHFISILNQTKISFSCKSITNAIITNNEHNYISS
jgi:hypothetical protein